MPPKRLCRLTFLVMTLTTLINACEQKQPPPREAGPVHYEGTIVAMGNSLTEGLGVAEESAYPAQLQQKLLQEGYPYRVINAGVSGETSSGALSRINWVLSLDPDIVILETGANDGLRGLDPLLIWKNIDEIIRNLEKTGVTVVLAGMQMVGNLGQDYTRAFADIYPSVAQRSSAVLVPFFLEGVGGKPGMNQADGIHPTAKGYSKVVDTIYPYVIQAIKLRRSHIATQ